MTMPINTFQDILDALARDPALVEQLQRHLLSQRLLDLPDVVAELTERVNQLAATVNDLVTVVTELKADVSVLKVDVSVLKEDVTELKADVSVLKADVSVLKADVSVLKEDVTELKADVSVLKEDVSELKAGQVRLETRQDIMQTDLNRISGTVARLDGTDYEHRAAKMLPRFARIRLNLPRQTTLLHCDTRNISINLPELDQALDSGTITPDQLENLQDADVIVAGSPLPEQPGFVLAESSITVQLEDVNRAAERADILRRATGRHVLSTVVGIDITDEAAQESQQRNVHFIRTDRDGRQIE